MTTVTNGKVEYINPAGLHRNPAFSNVVMVMGPVKTVYIGGQNAVNGKGEIVGQGDIARQTEQALTNLRIALEAGGAKPEHIIKWQIYIVQRQSLQQAFETFQRVWSRQPNPPTITVLFVAGLAHPDFLVELDAVAVVPELDY